MAFGDVNLSEEPIRDYGAGAGGWPTIRYFNQDTGYKGRAYEKKTSRSMCDELGDSKYMTEYVTEVGLTSSCDIALPASCTDKVRGPLCSRHTPPLGLSATCRLLTTSRALNSYPPKNEIKTKPRGGARLVRGSSVSKWVRYLFSCAGWSA